jgi:hypothetical protein
VGLTIIREGGDRGRFVCCVVALLRAAETTGLMSIDRAVMTDSLTFHLGLSRGPTYPLEGEGKAQWLSG